MTSIATCRCSLAWQAAICDEECDEKATLASVVIVLLRWYNIVNSCCIRNGCTPFLTLSLMQQLFTTLSHRSDRGNC
ncbi:unnamed protein product [Linum trigynum]|uniref:Uncharacterized protein n=1 Tax=Linum trigynum TaxID=586398 RepID=A0AAV2DTZ9_9ROSI